MAKKRVYKVLFHSQGEIYELFAGSVGAGAIPGFVEVEGLLFGERSEVLVDPSQERLETEFKGVKRIHLPIYAVLRIEEVEKEGVARISGKSEGGEKVAQFPGVVPPTATEPGER